MHDCSVDFVVVSKHAAIIQREGVHMSLLGKAASPSV